MKMRIQDNVIRFRLNRREVGDFDSSGKVAAAIEFPGGRRLTYVLEKTGGGEVAAAFDGDSIRIGVPEAMAHEWAAGDEVGIHESARGLQIVIEKDFQCMHKGEAGRDPEASIGTPWR
jgi:hypothetical protein